jgi:hypothetical protein
MRKVVVVTSVVVVLGLAIGWWAWARQPVTPAGPPTDGRDELMIKLRYETSDDLVPELDGFHTGQVCNVQCNDGVTRPVRIALLDRGLHRAGIILVQSRSPVGGDLGAVAYDPRGMGFVSLDWLRDHLAP